MAALRGLETIELQTAKIATRMKKSGVAGYPQTNAVLPSGGAPLPPIKEERRHGESEEDPVSEDHIVEELSVGPAERQQRWPRPPAPGSRRWECGSAGGASRALEEQSIVGHRLIDSRSREDDQAHETERRAHDSERDESSSPGSQNRGHGIGGGRGRMGETGNTERVKVRDVREHVDQHHDRDPEEKRSGEVPLRLENLARHVVRVLPAAVGEEYGNEGGAEDAEAQRRSNRRRQKTRPGPPIPRRRRGRSRSARRGLRGAAP